MSDPRITASAPRRATLAPRIAALTIAVAAAIAVWLIASAIGVRLSVTSPLVGTIPIDLLLTVATAVPAALAAWIAVAIIERRSARPVRTWYILSIALLAASLPPLLLLGAPAETVIALAAMHLAEGVPLIVLLGRTIPVRPAAASPVSAGAGLSHGVRP